MRLAGIATIEAANAFSERHNARFEKEPFKDKDLHRRLAVHDDVDLAMTWREERTLTAALTLHYNKVMFMLEPTEAASKLARKRVTIFEYPMVAWRSATETKSCATPCSTRCAG